VAAAARVSSGGGHVFPTGFGNCVLGADFEWRRGERDLVFNFVLKGRGFSRAVSSANVFKALAADDRQHIDETVCTRNEDCYENDNCPSDAEFCAELTGTK
jgi:hypothetical protein